MNTTLSPSGRPWLPQPAVPRRFRLPRIPLSLAVLWIAVAGILLVILRPAHHLEIHTAAGWESIGYTPSAWIWDPPQAAAGGRFRPDFARAALYALSIIVVAAATVATLRASRP